MPDRNGNVAFHDVLEAPARSTRRRGRHAAQARATARRRGRQADHQGLRRSLQGHRAAQDRHLAVLSAYIYAVIRMQNAIRKKLAKKRNSPDAGRQGNAFKDAARKKAAAQPARGQHLGGAPAPPRGDEAVSRRRERADHHLYDVHARLGRLLCAYLPAWPSRAI